MDLTRFVDESVSGAVVAVVARSTPSIGDLTVPGWAFALRIEEEFGVLPPKTRSDSSTWWSFCHCQLSAQMVFAWCHCVWFARRFAGKGNVDLWRIDQLLG